MITRLRLAALAALLALPCLAHATDPAPAASPAASRATTAAPAAAPATAAPVSAASDQHVAPAAATSGKVGAPPDGKGQVVFFRPRKFTGSMISFMVREGTKELGKLGSGNWFVAVLDPGAHDFLVHTENKDSLHMEVEAGETYYVMGSISMGFMAGHANIAPSDQAAFEKDFDSLKKSN